jgi:hypothetical protein
MRLDSIVHKIGDTSVWAKRAETTGPPVLREPKRFPYGPFQFKTQLSKGVTYVILASTDLQYWTPIGRGTATGELFDYVDSEAFKHSYRFYRLSVQDTHSANIIGYASITLPPGFSMIANPLVTSANTVAQLFQGWPDGTTLNKFDTRFFRLGENAVKEGRWVHPSEKLAPGEGAIFFNPTRDYKPLSFVGEVSHGNLSIPIPSGFSIRSSQFPQPGNLEDLGFPIAEGDVIHLFDRDRQQYVLHPYENGQWTAGPPVVSVGESFWVAKTEAGNWSKTFSLTE